MGKRVRDDSVTAIILAGGGNVRMGGRNKAFLKIGGKAFIEHQIERLQGVFDEIIISTNSPEEYSHLHLPVVTDAFPDKGPLGGIYSGLMGASNFFSFVIACDMPFVNIELIEFLKQQTSAGATGRAPLRNYDVIVPQSVTGIEPLHAFYSKNCIEPMGEQIENGELKLLDFLSLVNVRVVTLEEIGAIENASEALVNLNTEEEFKAAHLLLKTTTQSPPS